MGLVLSACLLACWLKHGVWLCRLTDGRRCPAADLWPRSCCETPLPSSSFEEHSGFVSDFGVEPVNPRFFPDAGGCAALTCWVYSLPFIDCALGPGCLPLTVSLCVPLVLYGHLIGCHWHWLTLWASSELVILSICPPTAQVINIWVTVQNAVPGVTAAPCARQSPSTPVLLSGNWVWCVNVMERCSETNTLSSLCYFFGSCGRV